MQKYFILLFSLFFTSFLWSQSSNNVPITLESPNNTMYVHLYYLQKDSYEPLKAAKALSKMDLSEEEVTKRAIQLKQILDGEGLYVRFNIVPTDNNYIDSLTHKAIYTPFPKELPDVFLEKKGDGKWYYSDQTVRAIPVLHKKVFPFGTDRLLNYLPLMGQTKILGLAVWQYLGLIILLIIGLFVHVILSRVLNFIFDKIKNRPSLERRWSQFSMHKIARYVSSLIIIQLIRVLLPVLLLPVTSMEYAISIIRIVSVVLIALIALRVVAVLMKYTEQFAQKTSSKMDEQLLPILRRFLQGVVIIGAIFQVLSILNVNVTALIAGASIGGLALALASQDAVKNLIGSVMIFIDKPFQIGDYITDGNISGTIEEVGFRSTRIRKSDSSLVSIPNGNLVNRSITNMGVRIYRLFQTQFGVTYQTPPERIQNFIVRLKELAGSHPSVREEGIYIALQSLDDSALSILFRVQLDVPDYASEISVKEELLFAVLQIAAELKVDFAYPTQTVFVEK